jgi:hypothetical protein
MVGSKKAFPSNKGRETMDGTGNDSNNNLFVFIGIVEILGAVG